MKRSLNSLAVWPMLLCLLSGTGNAAESNPPIRLSEPVHADANAEVFGAPLDERLPLRRLTDLVANAGSELGVPVRVTVRVEKVCQKKGCFFVATDGDTTVRVSFRDYGFFVPTDIGGRTVTLAGELVQMTHTEAQAEHLSADAGTTITPGPVYELVADSVRVPRP